MIEIGKPFELLEPTHRGLHRFVPRHPDEIEIDIGDPVYVQREAEDLWCEGNLQLSWSKNFIKVCNTKFLRFNIVNKCSRLEVTVMTTCKKVSFVQIDV